MNEQQTLERMESDLLDMIQARSLPDCTIPRAIDSLQSVRKILQELERLKTAAKNKSIFERAFGFTPISEQLKEPRPTWNPDGAA